jgi:hypothetical protein
MVSGPVSETGYGRQRPGKRLDLGLELAADY